MGSLWGKKDKKKTATKEKEVTPTKIDSLFDSLDTHEDDSWADWGQKKDDKKDEKKDDKKDDRKDDKKGKKKDAKSSSKALVEVNAEEPEPEPRSPTPPPAVPEVTDAGADDDFFGGWGTGKKDKKKKKAVTSAFDSPEASFHSDGPIKPDSIEEPKVDDIWGTSSSKKDKKKKGKNIPIEVVDDTPAVPDVEEETKVAEDDWASAWGAGKKDKKKSGMKPLGSRKRK